MTIKYQKEPIRKNSVSLLKNLAFFSQIKHIDRLDHPLPLFVFACFSKIPIVCRGIKTPPFQKQPPSPFWVTPTLISENFPRLHTHTHKHTQIFQVA